MKLNQGDDVGIKIDNRCYYLEQKTPEGTIGLYLHHLLFDINSEDFPSVYIVNHDRFYITELFGVSPYNPWIRFDAAIIAIFNRVS